MSIESIAEQVKTANPDVAFTGDVEDIQGASEYAEPGYSNPSAGILFANWNDFSREFTDALEDAGFEIEWSDEWTTCENCNRAVRTSPDSYGWTPSFAVVHECEILCSDCLKDEAESYLESLENNPRQAANIRGIDPADYGYTQLQNGFEYGFHPGQTDNPQEIFNMLSPEHPRLLFVIDGKGQFDIDFSIWTKVTA